MDMFKAVMEHFVMLVLLVVKNASMLLRLLTVQHVLLDFSKMSLLSMLTNAKPVLLKVA